MRMKGKIRMPWLAPFAAVFLVWSLWVLHRSLAPGSSSSFFSLTTIAALSAGTARPLILYAYYETDNARQNLEYFIAHGLHGAADFIFILNGETNAEDIIPKEPNIRYIHRPNDCYDLGAFAEVLTKDDLYKKYNKFITLNASVRGPFLPYWATGCWSDMFLSKVTDKVKVGWPFVVSDPQKFACSPSRD